MLAATGEEEFFQAVGENFRQFDRLILHSERIFHVEIRVCKSAHERKCGQIVNSHLLIVCRKQGVKKRAFRLKEISFQSCELTKWE